MTTLLACLVLGAAYYAARAWARTIAVPPAEPAPRWVYVPRRELKEAEVYAELRALPSSAYRGHAPPGGCS